MSRRWSRRLAWLVAAWAVCCGAPLVVQARPHPLLLALLLAAVAALGWGAQDLSEGVHAAGWGRDDEAVPARRGNDARASILLRLLRDKQHPLDLVERVRPMLVQLVDERLDTAYGVDRLQHRAAARAILGPDLADFAAGGPAPGVDQPAYLARVLSGIEAL